MPSDCEISPVEIWLSALRAQGRSPGTIESYRRSAAKLAEWSGGQDPLTITRLQALAFVRAMGERHAPGGVALFARSLRAFYSWAVEEGFAEANPFAKMRISVSERPQSTASEEQIEAMLARAKPNPRDYALLCLLVDTGCRRGELAAVERGDVDFRSGLVTFRVSKSRPRSVPLTDRALVAVSRWMKRRGTGQGPLWNVADPYSLINAACQRHSGGALRSHAMRRAFACRWLERGGSETGLERVGGWSSLAMVRTYVRARADDIAADEFRRLMG